MTLTPEKVSLIVAALREVGIIHGDKSQYTRLASSALHVTLSQPEQMHMKYSLACLIWRMKWNWREVEG